MNKYVNLSGKSKIVTELQEKQGDWGNSFSHAAKRSLSISVVTHHILYAQPKRTDSEENLKYLLKFSQFGYCCPTPLGCTKFVSSSTVVAAKVSFECQILQGQSNRNLHRMDVLWSLVQILQSKATAWWPYYFGGIILYRCVQSRVSCSMFY